MIWDTASRERRRQSSEPERYCRARGQLPGGLRRPDGICLQPWPLQPW